MEKYVDQLLADITYATQNVSWPYPKKESYELHEWIQEEEENKTAPVYKLEEWTGIKKEQLPPHERLTDEQVGRVLSALIKMLNEYNWSFVMQIEVPERFQYAAIRDYFDQDAKAKHWHHGFFEYCRPGTEHKKCALAEYCHCAFFAEMFKDMIHEELTPAEERARELEWEIQRIKKKYDDWMKYYPYHLDPKYDDENGNSHDYGFGDAEDDEDKDDDWWRK